MTRIARRMPGGLSTQPEGSYPVPIIAGSSDLSGVWGSTGRGTGALRIGGF
jgi:hypothetical protein